MLGELYTEDSRWSLLGIPTREEYVQRFVPLEALPVYVPEDVQESFRTVVHLVALAWYHYPLIDEAMKKLFGIAELAIKLRCQQIDIPLSTTHQGKEKYIPLARLINEVCAHTGQTDLADRLHSIRRVRNSYAHPGHHFYGGIAAVGAIKPMTATIVHLFVDAPQ